MNKRRGRPKVSTPEPVADPKAIGLALCPQIASRLELELAQRNMEVPHLAALARVTPEAIRRLLRCEGLPSLALIAALADALGRPRGWLAFGG